MVEVSKLALVALFVWCVIATAWGIFLAQDLRREKKKTANAIDSGKDTESDLMQQIQALEAEKIQIGREVIQLKDELAKFNGAENTECDHFVDEVKPKKSRSANGRFSKQ